MNDLSIVAIIPLYNGARWIEETIATALAQSVQPDEFIVVDDGSTDDGPAIVEKLARQHPIIQLLRKSNGGQSAARNFGVAHSRSALIALLDQDDRWYPNHLKALRAEFEKNEGMPLGWAYSDFDDIDGEGGFVDRCFLALGSWQNPKRNLNTILRQGLIIQPSATLISRVAFEAVGGFDENLSGYEDDDLFLRIFRASFDNAYIPESTSQWRIHDSSCGASDRMNASLRYYVKKLLAAFPDDRWRGSFYARDMIAPRFIATWLQMYVRAGRYKNYAQMHEYRREALALVPLLGMRPRRFVYAAGFPLLLFPRVGVPLIRVSQRTRRILRRVLGILTG
jgi:glycosyltransferase involved in cell wall biosynthesis